MHNSKQPDKLSITVAINTFNRPDDLSECLNSLRGQTIKNFDVLIVNGGDYKLIEPLVKNLSFFSKIVQQQRRGLVEARNLCWKETSADVVCMIDDDLIVSENWIEEILKTFSLDERIGGVTGPTIISKERSFNRDAIWMLNKFEKGNFIWKIFGKFYLSFILENKVKEIGKILEAGTFTLGSNFPSCTKSNDLIRVDYLEACHMCVRRKLVEKVGGFDYRFTGTGEWSEPDVSFKIRKLGYKLIFNPRAYSEHRISKQGIFSARSHAFERSVNFINFYFRHIKTDTLRKIVKFYSYLLFMNVYWIYKAISSRDIHWFSGILGTFYGLIKNTFHLCQSRS